MTDPRQTDPRLQDPTVSAPHRPWNAIWGWVVGIIVVVAVLAVIFIRPGDTPTASVSTPPAVTGAQPPSTTGQAAPSTKTPVNPSFQEPGKTK